MAMRMLWIATLVAVLAAVGLLMACGSDSDSAPAVYTDADTGRAVDAALGDTITIRLEENASTGYSWREEHTAGLELLADRSLAPSPSPALVGAPGTREYVFKAASAGTQAVTAVYSRPWEQGANSGREEFSLTVEVR